MLFRKLVLCSAALTVMSGSALAADQFLADRHKAKGIDCVMCHGPDKANPQESTKDTCSTCHPVKALVDKTAKVKPTNPHVSPHYASDLDCSGCSCPAKTSPTSATSSTSRSRNLRYCRLKLPSGLKKGNKNPA